MIHKLNKISNYLDCYSIIFYICLKGLDTNY